MKAIILRWVLVGVVGSVLCAPCPVQADPGEAAKAKVSLVPFVAGVAPGQAFDVGVKFELEPEWHIYWKNAGDSGLPPRVRWNLPEGFAPGELQFPIPKRQRSPGDIVTNVLGGEPILLTRITPPSNISTSSVALKAHVVYLVCADKCLREEADVSVELPAVETGQASPANAELYERAQRKLPKPASEYLTVTPLVPPAALSKPGEFEISLNVSIKSGLHIQSDNPTIPSLIAADAFLEKSDGLRLQRAVYPAPKVRADKYLGELREFEGDITIRIPAVLDDVNADMPPRIAGVFVYQACNDKGNCFPPDAVSFALENKTSTPGERLGDAHSTIAPAVQPGSPSDSPSSSTDNVLADGDRAVTEGDHAVDSGATVGATVPDRDGLEGFIRRSGLAGLLLGCFLYGLFINATPCVLPLLSIKVLGFVQQAHESRKRTLALGLSFGGGVMVFFVVRGFLAAGGKNILQFPPAVIGLGAIVMAMGLSMLGVFTLQPPMAATKLEASIRKEGLWSSFGKGALAPVLGFACTGPLLAGAFGWATQQPPHIAVLAFLFAGLGMASPYMLLGANPHWLSFLPRPGQWMIVFERIMGFLLLAMVIWLLHPLVSQIGVSGLEWTLVFLVGVGLACWVLGQVNFSMSAARRWVYRGGAVGFVVLSGGVIYEGVFPLHEAVAAAKAERDAKAICAAMDPQGEVHWLPWSTQAVRDAVAAGRFVFVDFTAAYCTQCKVNKFVAINTPDVIEKLAKLGAAALQADFTDGDKRVFAEMQRFGRAGPPMNLIYRPGQPDAPMLLETALSKEYLLGKLDEAASRSASVQNAGS